MNALIVVAHPDDEVLGAGAAIYQWTKKGHQADVAIMSTEARARANRPEDDLLSSDLNDSARTLGINHVYKGSFPNIEMNMVPHLRLVQFIEQAMIETGPDILVTHHPADVNNDHHQTALACQAALRLFQRRDDVKPVREFWYMEVPSSTEWSVDTSSAPFRPNIFLEVGEEGVDKKIEALGMYRGVMREFPHPRSAEGIKGLAALRGVQSGLEYAEAFEGVFRRIKS